MTTNGGVWSGRDRREPMDPFARVDEIFIDAYN